MIKCLSVRNGAAGIFGEVELGWCDLGGVALDYSLFSLIPAFYPILGLSTSFFPDLMLLWEGHPFGGINFRCGLLLHS